ncbi:hypothetical protein HBA55_14685 [Pseudomaricurvus alkylphenolicus]|uniref:YciI family protein n=1 Tax=Pseudomaricurvus alkylphenolicus TaxID=1306991 RepID=UPI00141E59DD|nr:YciI family protein [Pseudomaricurvus alkylphenolicus]NIB40845.1 hypothetical protein [Pseudomaricurvus alkylphenolicus]
MTDAIPTETVYVNSEGFLRMKLYVIQTAPAEDIESLAVHLKAHLEYQVMLEKRGILFAAGPIWGDDEDNWHGEGLVIIRAESLLQAQAIAAEDPMHSSGARHFQVKPWLLNEGSLEVNLSFSDCSMRLR